jgi:thymidine phosphorylase
MVAALGGPADFVERCETYLPKAPVVIPVPAPRSGYVGPVATREVGLAVVSLGGGRTHPEDVVDHAVGLTALVPVGAEIHQGEPLALVHARSENAAEKAAAEIRSAYRIVDSRPAAQKAVIRRLMPRE